jgi:hypothetical protein
MMHDPVLSPEVLQTKPWNNKLMYIPYILDSELSTNFSKQFYQWWEKYYKHTGKYIDKIKIRLIGKTNRTLEHYLIHKKPPKEILTRMEQSQS